MAKHIIMMLVAAAITSAFALTGGFERGAGGPAFEGIDGEVKVFSILGISVLR